MAPAIQSLHTALRHPDFEAEVLESARRAVAVTDGVQALGEDEEWLRQAVRGFVNLIEEAANGSGQEIRETFFSTVVPGLLAEGQPPEPLIRSSTTFLFLLGGQLVLRLPQADQMEAMAWFAIFAGSYVEDLHVACRSANE